MSTNQTIEAALGDEVLAASIEALPREDLEQVAASTIALSRAVEASPQGSIGEKTAKKALAAVTSNVAPLDTAMIDVVKENLQ